MEICNERTETKLNNYSRRPEGSAFSNDSIFQNEISLEASVIIPCYNSEAYLEKCLESVLNQTTDVKYEVIAVNDGSTDRTGNILDFFAKKYSNLVVVNQENKGFSGARNSGIRISRGSYLLFVDSDDYIEGDYINNLVGTAEKNNLELTVCGYMTFRDKRIIKKLDVDGSQDKALLNGCFWAKAFKRELFEHVIFPEGYWYEDSILAHLIYPQIKSFASVGGCLYAYRSNENGITIASRGNKKALDTFYITDLMINSVKRIWGDDYIKSVNYFKLLVEQFYLNQIRVKELDEEIKKLVFEAQAQFISSYYDDTYKTAWKYKGYLKALYRADYGRACIQIRMEKLYKLMEMIYRRIGIKHE